MIQGFDPGTPAPGKVIRIRKGSDQAGFYHQFMVEGHNRPQVWFLADPVKAVDGMRGQGYTFDVTTPYQDDSGTSPARNAHGMNDGHRRFVYHHATNEVIEVTP